MPDYRDTARRRAIRSKKLANKVWEPMIPDFIAKDVAQYAMKQHNMSYQEFVEFFIRIRIENHKADKRYRAQDFTISTRRLTIPGYLMYQYAEISDDRLRDVEKQLWWELDEFIRRAKKQKSWPK